MAYGDGILTAFDSGLQSGHLLKEQRKKNLLAQILSQGYRSGTPGFNPLTPKDDEGNVNPVMPAKPAGMDWDNTIAKLYQGGLGPEAMQIEQQRDQNELAKLLKTAQASKLMETEAPKSRQVPFGDGMIRTEEWDAQNRVWKKIAEGKKSPLVNVDTGAKQNNKASEEIGKALGEQYMNLQKSGSVAQTKMNRVARLEQLLAGVDTGKLTPAGKEIAGYARTFGYKTDPKWSNIEAAEALANEMSLELRNPAGGAGMPGALSDKDREFLTRMVPGIEKTPEGRKLIIETARRMAKREADIASLAREYRRKMGGNFDEGFYDQLADYSAKNPLFGDLTGMESSGPIGGNQSDPLGLFNK